MGIPSPLSFPPTALRNVAAGLVVGNPIGSGGTRGKALTAAELKAIVEASGISYLPLSGGTMTGALSLGSNDLTCGAITVSGNVNIGSSGKLNLTTGNNSAILDSTSAYGTARISQASGGLIIYPAAGGLTASSAVGISYDGAYSVSSGKYFGWLAGNDFSDLPQTRLYKGASAGAIAQRNGLNAQCYLLSKSYTSDASQEALMLDSGKQISGKLGLYSYRGSSAGGNYPIRIGMLAADGSTFSGMIVSTDGTTQIILPTSDPHVVGVLWNNSGTITISAG